MKKTSLLVTLLLIASTIITSCSSYSKHTSDEAMTESTTVNQYSNTENYYDGKYKTLTTGSSYAADMEAEYIAEEAPDAEFSEDQGLNAERKIIYTSEFNIQTTEYDDAITAMNELCEKYGAYFEKSENYGTAEKANRHGYFKIRVPVKSYTAFRNSTGNIGTVIRSSENNTDVTENYFDTEARLSSAKIREERLIAILATADSLDNILLLEAELADVRYEIEKYSGTLRKYDSLVSYSTITINIEEVTKPVIVKTAPKTFGERISQATTNGLEDFRESLEDLAVELSYNLPSIIIFIIFVIVIIVVLKSVSKKRKKNKRAKLIQEIAADDKKENV